MAVKDPLARLRALLRSEGLADDPFDDETTAVAEDAAARLRRGCLALPDPPPDALFEHVYAGPHPLLQEEREAYEDYLSTLES